MIQNAIIFLVELPGIRECGGMIIFILSATQLGWDFEEDIGSTFYVIMTLLVTTANMYFIWAIAKGSMHLYAYTHTHKHTHTYIYIYIYIYAFNRCASRPL